MICSIVIFVFSLLSLSLWFICLCFRLLVKTPRLSSIETNLNWVSDLTLHTCVQFSVCRVIYRLWLVVAIVDDDFCFLFVSSPSTPFNHKFSFEMEHSLSRLSRLLRILDWKISIFSCNILNNLFISSFFSFFCLVSYGYL